MQTRYRDAAVLPSDKCIITSQTFLLTVSSQDLAIKRPDVIMQGESWGMANEFNITHFNLICFHLTIYIFCKIL